jgi:uncharacterized protein involved in outer membrane biogenesis
MSIKRIAASLLTLVVVAAGGGLAYVSLVLLEPERVKPLLAEQIEKATGRTLTIEGELEPTLSLTPTLTASQISLSNADWGKADYFVKAEQLNISFSLIPLLLGNTTIDAISITGAEVWLEQKGGKSNWEFDIDVEEVIATEEDAPLPAEPQKDTNFAISLLEMKDSNIHYHQLDAGGQKLTLAISRLDLTGFSTGELESASLKAKYNQADLDATASMADDVLQLKAALNMAKSSVGMTGSLSLKDFVFDAALLIDSQKLNEVLALAGVKSDDVTAFKLDTALGGTAKLMSINQLALTYGDISVAGTGKLDLSAKKPSINGALKMAALDLRGKAKPAAAAPAATNDEAPTAAPKAGAIPRTPLPFDALKSLNATLDFALDEVLMDDGKFSKISSNIALKDGVLALTNIKAHKADGSLSGSLKVNANAAPPSVALKLKSNKLTIGGLMQEMGADSVTGGALTADLTLSGSGASLHDIAKTAAGNYDVLVEKATYMPPSGVSQATAFFDVLRGKDVGSAIDIKCGIVQFGIEGGVATTKALAIQAPNAIVTGTGDINLGEEKLSLQLKARSTVLGFADVVPPLAISGPWSKVTTNLSAQNTLLNIGKYALGAATGVGLIAIVGEQFTDKLGITAENNPCMKSINEAAEKAAKADADPKAALKDAEKTYLENRDAIKDNVKGTIKDGEQDVKAIRDGLKGLLGK